MKTSFFLGISCASGRVKRQSVLGAQCAWAESDVFYRRQQDGGTLPCPLPSHRVCSPWVPPACLAKCTRSCSPWSTSFSSFPLDPRQFSLVSSTSHYSSVANGHCHPVLRLQCSVPGWLWLESSLSIIRKVKP